MTATVLAHVEAGTDMPTGNLYGEAEAGLDGARPAAIVVRTNTLRQVRVVQLVLLHAVALSIAAAIIVHF